MAQANDEKLIWTFLIKLVDDFALLRRYHQVCLSS